MSGLAQILFDLGNEVKGADVINSLFCEKQVLDKGIIIEDIDNMDYSDADVVIIGNVFLDKFTIKDKEVLTYQEALSYISEKYYSIAVCGTHGKTTISNMIKHVLSSKQNTSYLIGDGQGKANKDSKYFVFEACEHKEHFLNYFPNMIVCSNVEYDHVDYYQSKRHYKKAFSSFFENAKDVLILNENIKYNGTKNNISYGTNKSNVKAENIKYHSEGISFTLKVNGQIYTDITLPFYGKHMLNNTLACISCCYLLNINILDIINSLKTYKNATRRYNITYINDNVIVDDYGHHPDEINATISSIKQQFPDKELYIIYHPDRPKRLTCFLYKFEKAFKKAKMTFILPFLNMDKEKENALQSIVNNKNIIMYDEKLINKQYSNCIFLFTGSKEMKIQINLLIQAQKKTKL